MIGYLTGFIKGLFSQPPGMCASLRGGAIVAVGPSPLVVVVIKKKKETTPRASSR